MELDLCSLIDIPMKFMFHNKLKGLLIISKTPKKLDEWANVLQGSLPPVLSARPNGPVFNYKMVWAHSISYDLINWVHRNHALEPTHPFDINGCWLALILTIIKYVMKASFDSHDYYTLGSYAPEKEKFTSDSDSDFDFDFRGRTLGLRYDYGKFYASKTFYDSFHKRRILWGWVNESDSREDDIKKGWSGLQAVPRNIWLSKTGRQLIQWPVEEIETLRRNHFSLLRKELRVRSTMKVPGGSASQIDAEVSFEFPYLDLEEVEQMDTRLVDPELLCSKRDASVNSRVGPFGLLVLASNDLSEHTAIFFHILKAHNRYVVLMCSDQRRSSFREEGVDKTTYGAFVDIDPRHEKISLRTLVDRSIVREL